MGGTLARLLVELGLQNKMGPGLKDAQNDIKGLDSKVKALGKSMSGLGNTLTRSVTLPLVGIGTAAVATAAIYDEAITNVQTVTGKFSDETLAQINTRIAGMASATGQGPVVLANAMYDVVSVGFSASEALDIVDVSARAAVAGLTDAGTATDGITTLMKAFPPGVYDANEAADIFFNTINLGKTTFPELASAIGRVLPLASSMGVSAEDVGAGLAVMTTQGISTDESVTQLGAVMSAFLKPSAAMTAAVQAAGYESAAALLETEGLGGAMEFLEEATGGSTEELARLVPDVNATRGALALMIDEGERFDEFRAGFDEAGAASAAFAIQTEAAAFKLAQAKAEMQNLAIVVGNILLPYVILGAKWLGRMALKFQQLSKRTQNIIVIIGLVAAALGPLLIGLGFVASAIGSIIALAPALGVAFAILTGPVGAAIAIAAVLFLAYKTNFLHLGDLVDWFAAKIGGPFVKRIIASIMKIVGGFIDLFKAIKKGDPSAAFKALKKILAGVGDALGAPAKAIGDFFKSIQTGFAPLDAFLHTIGKLWTDFGRLIQEVFQGDWKGALEVGERMLRHFWELVQQGLDLLIALFKAIPWGDIWEGLKTAAVAALKGLVSLGGMALSALVSLFQAVDWGAVGSAIVSGLLTAVTIVGGWLLSLGSLLLGYVPSWSDIVSGLGTLGGVFQTVLDDYIIPGALVVFEWFGGLVTKVTDKLPGSWQDVIDLLAPLGNVFDAVKTALQTAWGLVLVIFAVVLSAIKAALPSSWSGVSTLLDPLGVVFDVARAALQTAWGLVLTIFSVALGAIKAALPTNWVGVSTLIDTLGDVFDMALTALQTARDGVVGVFSGIKGLIEAAIPKDWGFVSTGFDGLVSAFQGAWDLLEPIVDKIEDGLGLLNVIPGVDVGGGGGGQSEVPQVSGPLIGPPAPTPATDQQITEFLSAESARRQAAAARVAIANELVGLRNDVTTLMGLIQDEIYEGLADAVTRAQTEGGELRAGYVNELIGLRTDAVAVVDSIRSALATGFLMTRDRVVSGAADARAGVANEFVGLRTDLVSIVDGTRSAVATGFLMLRDRVVSSAASARAGVANEFVGLRGDMASIAQSAADRVVGALTGIRSRVAGVGYGVGYDIGSGIYNGLGAWLSAVAQRAADLVNSAENAARSAIDAHSDSRVWYRVADDMVGGLLTRLEQARREVAYAITALPLTPALGSANPLAPVGAGTMTLSSPSPTVVNHNYYLTPPEFQKLMTDAEKGAEFAEGFGAEVQRREGF